MVWDMVASYAGMAGCLALLALFLKYVTAFRFVMGLIFLAGLAFAAAGGFLLAWPLLSYLALTKTNWIATGPLFGCLFWIVVIWRGWGVSPRISLPERR